METMDFSGFDSDFDDPFDESTSEDTFVERTQNVINDENAPQKEHLFCLSKQFGHKEFRPMQWSIISSIINEKRDNCSIMATGYGKSLCYQFPPVFLKGIAIVVSPLISLMEDQVLSLKVTNISACMLGSANTKQAKTVDDIFENKYSIIYCTPEFVTGDYGSDLIKRIKQNLNIVLIAIDEAHCVSSWGHDFRVKYRELGCLKKMLPDVPILAVTATATNKVRNDIIKSLNLKNPLLSCSGFDRSNLYFAVYMKSSLGVFQDIRKYVMEITDNGWKFTGSTILYCITRKDTEEIANVLQSHGVNCLPYHAGLPLKERKETHANFLKDKVDCIVATIAFGMGIDKPDVRNVVHYGTSGSIEAYYQEVGRAGRDGLPSKCVCFYSNADFVKHNFLAEKGHGSKNLRKNLLDIMKEYLITTGCRREFILTHFEGSSVKVPYYTLCCDNCTRKKTCPDENYEGVDDKGFYDFTEDGKIFLKTVEIMDGNFGITNYLYFLRGSKNAKLFKKYQEHPQHGWGKHKSEAWWKAVSNILIKEKYLDKADKKTQYGTFYTYHLSELGRMFLQKLEYDNACLKFEPTSEVIPMLKKKTNASLSSTFGADTRLNNLLNKQNSEISNKAESSSMKKDADKTIDDLDGEDSKLYRLLMNKRSELATQLDCMPYSIASNAVLMAMAKNKPRNLEQLKNVGGFSENKIETFGRAFLKVVLFYLGLNQGMEEKKSEDSIFNILERHPIIEKKLGATMETSYNLFKAGKSLSEIAAERNLKEGTIINHLSEAMKMGYEIKMEALNVIPVVRDVILKTIKAKGYETLTTIKEACPPNITFEEIKIVMAYAKIRDHLKNLDFPYTEFEDLSYEEICSNLDTKAPNLKTEKDELPSTSQQEDWDSDATDIYSDGENTQEKSKSSECKYDSDENPQKKLKIDDEFGNILNDLENMNENEENIDSNRNLNSQESHTQVLSQTQDFSQSLAPKKAKKLPPWMCLKKV
ncbi:unnamed protein product [Brassicogethes aeneus]|uniref:ATP-dependent DNA helicase n=1 Tax=Brassicogethes aeneus TaxID=1431903 RepID=A0A9P0FH81_BRAAE|nr:unnamed protein product [Brassicogethes aeneus]